MKKILALAAMTFSLCSGFKSEAQVHVNIQIGAPVAQQSWYSNDDDYYYMPDQGVYYNVRRQCYVYPEGNSWLYANSLPARYGGYSWNSGRYYRVHEYAPFRRNDYYRSQYSVANNGGYRGGNQQAYGGYGRHDHGDYRGRDRNGGGNGYGNGGGYQNGGNQGGDRNGGNNGGGYQNGGSHHYNRR